MKSQHIEEETKSTGAHSHSGQGSDLDSSQLSNIELIRKAEECVDKLKLEKAVALYDEGIRRWPNDTLILD
jgi:tetratricopeptide (TPR) repeat protein